jgi:hypothetical protein
MSGRFVRAFGRLLAECTCFNFRIAQLRSNPLIDGTLATLDKQRFAISLP